VIGPRCDEPKPVWWRDLLTAIAVSMAPIVVQQIGEGIRERLAHKRGDSSAPKQ
jgi:hypothetical protein